MSKQAVSIGESIRARRVALRLSQRDLACAAGTTAAAICHVERGIRKLSASLLVRLAGALQCSTDDLLGQAVPALEDEPCLQQVIAAMKSFPPAVQAEVLG